MKFYRVVHRIHLGGTEQVLEVGSIVQFNGTTLKTEDGGEVPLGQPSAILGAIKVGWLVPVASSETGYVPKAAGIQVHSAKSSGERRTAVNLMTVHDEEHNVGDRRDIRQHKTASRTQTTSGGGSQGEVVVGKIQISAKSKPVVVGEQDQKILQQLSRPRTAAPAPLAGDELEDIFPDAASSGRPKAGKFVDEGVHTGRGGSPIGGEEEGVVIGKVGTPRTPTRPLSHQRPLEEAPQEEESMLPEDKAFQEKALRRWARTGKTWNGLPVSLADLSQMVLTVLEALDSAKLSGKQSPPAPQQAAKPVLPEEEMEEEGSEEEDLSETGEFHWDMTPHWKTRQATLQEYKDDPTALRAIYKVENSGGVKKLIESFMETLGETLR